MDGKEAAHERVDPAVIGITARFESGKEIAGVRPYEAGIKGTGVSKTAII